MAVTTATVAAAEPPVLWDDADGVRTITLNRPDRLNAVDLAMIEQLEAALLSAQEREDVAVILLRGAGRAFCAGDDVHAQTDIGLAGEAALRAQLARLQNISVLLTLGRAITVVEVRGWAIGAGFSWALNADFRVWGDTAGAFFPEVGFGTFVTGGATFLLERLVGAQTAADALFRGTRLRPAEPRAAGLVQAVHPDAALASAAADLARELAALPAAAATRMKRALVDGWAPAFRAALERETDACVATTLDPATLARMRAAVGGR